MVVAAVVAEVVVPNLIRRGVVVEFSTVSGFFVDWGGIYVQVAAINADTGSLVNLFAGYLKGPELFLDSQEPIFRGVLESYSYLDRGTLSTCLLIDIWVHLRNGSILRAEPPRCVEVRPSKALKELVRARVTLNPESMVEVRVPQREILKKQETLAPIMPLEYFCYRWENVSGYTYVTGWVDLPILIVHNDAYYSGVVYWGISLGMYNERVTFRISVSYGFDILGRLAEGESVDLKIYSTGWSISEQYWFSALGDVLPLRYQWAYIRARIAHIHQVEMLYLFCSGDGISTGNERILQYVYAVSVYGNTIVGGVRDGPPPSDLMGWLFAGTREEKLTIPGTSLEDGKLDVGENIPFPLIFSYYDTCTADFEVGIPVGAIIATLLGITGPYAALIAPLSISLGAGQSSSVFVVGGLQNYGVRHGQGFNVYEEVYMRVSNYKYTKEQCFLFFCSRCEYNVPVGIYFRTY